MEFLKTLVPLLGTALGGPFGGIAAGFIADKLGMSDKTVSAVTDLIKSGTMTPEQITGLKMAELDMQKFIETNQIKREQLAYEDVQNARKLLSDTHSLTPSILTWIIVAITLTAEGALLFNQVPPGVDAVIVGRILGTMDSALIMVLGFWFGANSGSARTKELLAQATMK
jgi:hypothetical protein